MKNYVIAIEDNPKSMTYAHRCIASGYSVGGININIFNAITPRNTNVREMLAENLIPETNFDEVYSRTDNCIAAFLSHFSLWKMCAAGHDTFTIFEHDAVCTNNINSMMSFEHVLNIGEPSYGKYNTPASFGVGPLVSKKYFPGAHAYMVTPKGAQMLIDRAMVDGGPTDTFLHIDRFPTLQEYYPWLAKADDAFTTIQVERGCLAKHNWGDGYEII